MRYLEDETTYILANFNTGEAVGIDVYRLSDNVKVVNAASMTEIGTTGRFKYSFSQSISAKTEYLYICTNAIEEQQGKIVLGGYPDTIKDKTDNLPNDPAGIIDIQQELSQTEVNIRGGYDTLDSLSDQNDRILDATEIRQCSVAAAGATTTKFISDLTEPETGYWKRMAVLFTSGNNDGQMRRIKAYNGDTKEITLQTPLDTAPANGDLFILPTVRAFLTPDIEDLADAVWDEDLSTHITTKTAGKIMQQIKSVVNAIIGLIS